MPITYKDFTEWKVNGWMLPSSVDCIIREEDIKTGVISEKVYCSYKAAVKYIEDRTVGKTWDDNPKIYTVCNNEAVNVLKPRHMIKDHEEEYIISNEDAIKPPDSFWDTEDFDNPYIEEDYDDGQFI
tara:strand:+ start:846 stop:1226 length:381 start_codon:yes stop_codon:yes gene_type:complete